ncbi:uncharacterized protein LOC126901739 isoform X15 [Daktulosphaira vitifoliae]|uniref:uncharacterized protein LOC126901739 isoform X15 n=1 Tax=Daktulosphaira vitifoliae TaxID=58002 RepID=UPI0021AACBB2|nr:uncharacterized protein LOC126901739 isoform X15 [Daktulosphaira vitifoliae]
MRLYFCFGILLCFISLITIPKFSTGMPSSGGSTSNNQGDSSGVNNNEDPNPISTYYSTCINNILWEMADNDIKSIKPFFDKVLSESKVKKSMRNRINNIIESIIDSDDKTDAINECTEFIVNLTKNNEDELKRNLCEGDPNNIETITQDYAKLTLSESSFNTSPKLKKFFDFLIEKNLNDKHQVLYKELLKNFGPIMQEFEDTFEFKDYEVDENDEDDDDY